MGDVISYLDEFGGYSFAEKPLCEIDGLILAHFAYYVFDDIVPTLEERYRSIPLSELAGRMKEDHFVSVTWEEEKNKKFFYQIITTRRFRSARACCYVNEIDHEQDLQFGAITLLLGNGDIFIAFRGTDDALVGWKEDFYMAYRTPVAAQRRSQEYVEQVARFWGKKKKARFYFGGHSKGGNLAVYAAMTCKERLRARIGRVYNMDGPGFRPDFLETLDYDGVKDKVFKFIPKESFIGMLMQGQQEYILIESIAVGVLQHVPLSWCIEGDTFVRAQSEDIGRKQLYDRMNQWLLAMDKEKIAVFLENLFRVVEVTQAETLTELSTDLLKKSKEILIAYREMPEETKAVLWEMGIFLIELAAKDQQERIRRWKLLNRLRQLWLKEGNEQ